MKMLVLAAVGTAALWSGSAHAHNNTPTRPVQATEQQGQLLAYATTTRGQISIYSTFRNDGYSQGGEQ